MIHDQIKADLKDAMRAKDAVKMTTLRGLLAAFTNELVAQKKKPDEPVTDEIALAVIRRGVKQRKDAIEQFEKGGRPELAANEQAELTILGLYLPAQMPREEIKKIAEAKKAELGVTDKTKLGQLTGAIMKDLKGKADGADVKAVVESLFA
ncbi:MAG: GatB/YqeY domain-containing protein [Patescibacteria group bacterium]